MAPSTFGLLQGKGFSFSWEAGFDRRLKALAPPSLTLQRKKPSPAAACSPHQNLPQSRSRNLLLQLRGDRNHPEEHETWRFGAKTMGKKKERKQTKSPSWFRTEDARGAGHHRASWGAGTATAPPPARREAAGFSPSPISFF